MKTKCTVGYHFYTLDTWLHRLIKISTGYRISHVLVSVETESIRLYYDCTWGVLSDWYTDLSPYNSPSHSLHEYLDIDLDMLDMLLPKGEHYSAWKVVSNLLCGYPRSPSSCVSSVHRLRFLCGKPTKGRSPGAVYKYLRKELCSSTRTTG